MANALLSRHDFWPNVEDHGGCDGLQEFKDRFLAAYALPVCF